MPTLPPGYLTLILHAAQRLARAGYPVTPRSVYREVRPHLSKTRTEGRRDPLIQRVNAGIAELVKAGIGPFPPDIFDVRDDEQTWENDMEYIPKPRELALAVAKFRCRKRLAGNGTHALTEADREKRMYRVVYHGNGRRYD